MKFNEEQRKQINDTLYHPTMSIPEMIDRIESILSQPDAERGKEERNPVESGQSDQDATEIIDPYVYNDYVGDPSDGNRVSFVFKEDAIRLMTEFASSKTSRLRAELEDLNITHLQVCEKLKKSEINKVKVIQELSAAKEYNKSLMDNFAYETGKLESALSAANQRIAELEGQVQDLGSQM
jgi:hypothetical protein